MHGMAFTEPQGDLSRRANGWPAEQARSQQSSNLMLPQYGSLLSQKHMIRHEAAMGCTALDHIVG